MLGPRKGRRLRRRRKKKLFKSVATELYVAVASELDDTGKLTRVLLTDFTGRCLLDYDLQEAGHSMEHLFSQIVPQLIHKDKVVVGYCISETFFRPLHIQHPWMNTRDVASFSPLMEERFDALSRMLVPCSIENLAARLLNSKVHSPLDEAQALMKIYQKVRNDWETEISELIQQQDCQRRMVLSKRLEEQTITTGEWTSGDWTANEQETDENFALGLVISESGPQSADTTNGWFVDIDRKGHQSEFHLPSSLLNDVS